MRFQQKQRHCQDKIAKGCAKPLMIINSRQRNECIALIHLLLKIIHLTRLSCLQLFRDYREAKENYYYFHNQYFFTKRVMVGQVCIIYLLMCLSLPDFSTDLRFNLEYNTGLTLKRLLHCYAPPETDALKTC